MVVAAASSPVHGSYPRPCACALGPGGQVPGGRRAGLWRGRACHNTVVWDMGNKQGSRLDMAFGSMDRRGRLKTVSGVYTSNQAASEAYTNSPACMT